MKRELEFTETELMICVASRIFENEKTYIIGFGMPQICCMLAQKLHAPNLTMAYEYGTIGPRLQAFDPLLMGGSADNYRAVAWMDMNWLFWQASTGLFDYAVLGAAQIDQYGNINSTMIGEDYSHPRVRLAGSGGANEMASLCWQTIVIMLHEKRRLVEKVDFLTTPGFLDGSEGARERVGLPRGTGPHRVITSKALFGYDEATRKMKLLATMPHITPEEVLEDMMFKPLLADKIDKLAPPTEEELLFLRQELDPKGAVIKGGSLIKLEVSQQKRSASRLRK